MVYLGFCSEEATQSEQIKLKLNMTRISRREVEETIERRQGCKNSTSFSRHKNGEQLCQNKTLSERFNKIFNQTRLPSLIKFIPSFFKKWAIPGSFYLFSSFQYS